MKKRLASFQLCTSKSKSVALHLQKCFLIHSRQIAIKNNRIDLNNKTYKQLSDDTPNECLIFLTCI